MKISGAIFDLDGTLLDTMAAWETLGSDYLRTRGITADNSLNEKLKTMSLVQAAEYCRESYNLPDSVSDIARGVAALVEHYYFDSFLPKSGVPEFLALLSKKKIKMCVATATERRLAEAALLRNGLRGYFCDIITCPDVGFGKDSPVIFETALASLGTPKAETVIFEDSLHAIDTAKKAGFRVFGVFDEFEKNPAAIKARADYYICSFNEMRDYLD